MGNAKSLRGGALLMTPLKGINGEIYAIAQGSLIVSDSAPGLMVQRDGKYAQCGPYPQRGNG